MDDHMLFVMLVFIYLPTSVTAGDTRAVPGKWRSTEMPEGMPFCRSCQGTCGSRRLPAYCNCDHLCVLSGDCCSDFPQQCPVQRQRGLHLNVTYGTALDSCDLPDPRSYYTRPRLIASCSRDSSACKVSDSDLFSFVPAQDEDTGLNFITIKCAMCNGVRRLKPWEIEVTSSGDFGNADVVDGLLRDYKLLKRNLIFSVRSGGHEIQRCDTDVQFIGLKIFCDEPSETECNRCARCFKTIKGQALFYRYRYVSCSLCGKDNMTLNDICRFRKSYHFYRDHIIRHALSDKHEIVIHPPYSGRFSRLSILFDIRDDHELSVRLDLTNSHLPRCPPGYSEDGLFTCKRDKHIKQLDTYKNITEQQPNTPNTTERAHPHQNLENLLLEMKDNLQRSIQWINSSQVELYLNKTSRNVVVELVIYSETKQEFENLIDGIKMNVTREVQYIFGHNPRLYEVLNISLAVYSCLATHRLRDLTPSILCHFMIDSHTDKHLNHSLLGWMNITKNYKTSRNTVFTCVDYLSNKAVKSSDQILYILEVVLLCTSVVALSICVGMWLTFRNFQCSGRRVQTVFMTAMMSSHLLLLLSSLAAPGSVACYIMGVCLHWFYLMMFAWMSVLAVDIARMILSSSRLHKLDVNNKDFAYYCVVAIGLPTLIVTMSVIIDQTNMRADLKPNYGGKHCWISGTYPLLIFFAVPVAGVLLLNGVCFTVAIVLLCRTAYTCSRSVDHRANAVLYIKLFILMGLTWSLGFVSKYTGSLVVRYFYTILNASQGFLVAMAAIFSTHSRTILRNSLKQRSRSRSSSSRSPKTPGKKSFQLPSDMRYD